MPTLKSAAAPRSIILKVLDPIRAKKKGGKSEQIFCYKIKSKLRFCYHPLKISRFEVLCLCEQSPSNEVHQEQIRVVSLLFE